MKIIISKKITKLQTNPKPLGFHGGSMAKWVKEGNKVFKLTLSDNDTRFKDKKIYVKPHEAKSESKKACEILGVEELSLISSASKMQLYYIYLVPYINQPFILSIIL